MSSLKGAPQKLRYLRKLPIYFDHNERRWLTRSAVIGVVVWAAVFLLRLLVHGLFESVLQVLEAAPSIWLVFIPLAAGALITAFLAGYHESRLYFHDDQGKMHELNAVEGDGLERAISLYFSSEPNLEHTLTGEAGVNVRWRLPTFSLATRKFLATLATLGGGGSGGLEASVTLIGESISAGLFKTREPIEQLVRRNGVLERFWNWWSTADPDDLQTAQLGGIAAAISTLLGAPFAGAFFAIEVMYRRRPIIEKLIYALIPSLIAYFLTRLVTDGPAGIFAVEILPNPPTTPRYYLMVLLSAALISLVGLYFKRLRTSVDRWFHHLRVPRWQRHLLGAGLTGLIAVAVAVGTRSWFGFERGFELVLGPGESAIEAALNSELTWQLAAIALVAKLLATVFTITSGGSAGLLVPSIFFGSMVAAGLASLLGWNALVLVIPAMSASLVSIVNIPLAATLFTVEVFDSAYLLPALVTLVAVSILTHQNNIYRTQRERYDSRQIMPGYSVRRVSVPRGWSGKNLTELRLRNRFDVIVIGLVIQHEHQGAYHQHIRPDPDLVETPLNADDVLVVLGQDDRLEAFEAGLQAERSAEERSARRRRQREQ